MLRKSAITLYSSELEVLLELEQTFLGLKVFLNDVRDVHEPLLENIWEQVVKEKEKDKGDEGNRSADSLMLRKNTLEPDKVEIERSPFEYIGKWTGSNPR
jgi:hypothetical protein